jgi:A/G-specific adenine glycosylase
MKAALPIIPWYQQHKRDLPWRNTTDPYLIWLSEVILQQTRVDQGLPYYLRFSEAYPTVTHLAAANDDDVMKLWQGLGYYNRAKNMLRTARIIADEHAGIFPRTYDELIGLKGIGPYTGAAIASFAFNEAKAVVDGNVYRVLARVFGIDEPINSPKGQKTFRELAQEIMDANHPAEYNQAIMELGATVCTPQKPKCSECVLRLQCYAYKHEAAGSLPVKLKKNKPRDRFLHFFFIEQDGYTYIRQRTSERIWHNLYEPPFIETAAPEEDPFGTELMAKLMDWSSDTVFEKAFSVKHQLTHQTIYADFWKVTAGKKITFRDDTYIRVKMSDLCRYAVHRLFDKFLNYHTLQGNQHS